VVRAPADSLPPASRPGYEALRRKFLAGLPARWQEIEQAPDAAARAAALHRLAGAAGSYGCDELGQAARAAEHLAVGAAGPALARALAEVDRLLRQASMS
jgi:HPt (histidine-containing phosphotransfer) domain-containing protein